MIQTLSAAAALAIVIATAAEHSPAAYNSSVVHCTARGSVFPLTSTILSSLLLLSRQEAVIVIALGLIPKPALVTMALVATVVAVDRHHHHHPLCRTIVPKLVI
jgi:hypothetical protein